MTRQLYEEALADIKRLKEVAEDNAKRALTEAVTPRIREFIEQELLREENLDQDAPGAPGSVPAKGDLVTDDMSDPAIETDEDGNQVLDLGALGDEAGSPVGAPMYGTSVEGDEFTLNAESVKSIAPLLRASNAGLVKEFESSLYRLGENINLLKGAGKLVRESSGFRDQISEMISRVENMYEYVQESISNPASKKSYEARLETYFQELRKLQEQKMSKKARNRNLTEMDMTLKLTGLPDDVDLDSLGVDLITGEEEGEETEEMGEEGEESGEEGLGGEEGEEEGGEEEGGDEDMDLELSDEEEGGEDEDDDLEEEGVAPAMESRRLGDNVVVEIDEGMLRREIARMKALREDKVPSTKGAGPGKAGVKAFGDGEDEGDPWLDQKVTTESSVDEGDVLDELDEAGAAAEDGEGKLSVESYDDDLDEMDLGDDDDLDEMDQAKGESDREDKNVQDRDIKPGANESFVRRLAFEKRLQERLKTRGRSLKAEAARTKNGKKVSVLRTEYARLAARFNESVKRESGLKRTLAESAARKKKQQNVASGRLAENKAVANLRDKLAETNLFNAKLMYSNKLLQNESLSKRQKAEIIERLDEATNIREAKLIFETLVKTMAGNAKPLTEGADRKVIGSASRPTRPASTNLSEGASAYEVDRWAQLAGINRNR